MQQKLLLINVLLFLAVAVVLAVVILLFFKTNPPKKPVSVFFEPTPSPSVQKVDTEKEIESASDYAHVENIEGWPDFLKKEVFGKLLVYYLESDDINRPNLLITTGLGDEKRTLFSRTRVFKTESLDLSTVMGVLGQPEKIIKGSLYYGQDKEVYLYPAQGESMVVDPEREVVLEETSFPPTTVERYIEEFGVFL